MTDANQRSAREIYAARPERRAQTINQWPAGRHSGAPITRRWPLCSKAAAYKVFARACVRVRASIDRLAGLLIVCARLCLIGLVGSLAANFSLDFFYSNAAAAAALPVCLLLLA